MSRAKRCARCGHTERDHEDGIMGARSGDDWLCHQDDHTCYGVVADHHAVGGQLPAPTTWALIGEQGPELRRFPCGVTVRPWSE